MAKLITNISALMLIVLLVSSNGFLKAEAQQCFKGEADVEGVCVGVDGDNLCDVACKVKGGPDTTWVGLCEEEEVDGKIEMHCHCYGPC